MTALALCLLALADAAFSGFRAQAGRDGRIVKRSSKVRASATGAIAGAIALVFLAALLLSAMAIDRVTYDELVAGGERMLSVYAVYATTITVGFLAYFSPWLEVRSLATMLVLGPGTFVRPVVILFGAFAATYSSGGDVFWLAAVTVTLMLSVEPLLGRWFDHHPVKGTAVYPPRRA